MNDSTRTMCLLAPRLAAILALLCYPSAALPQADFLNYEVGQVAPLALATVSFGDEARELLLVCNTPNDCLEVYDAAPPFAFIDRIPTGIAPVTVRWNAAQGRAYTCNHIGDSISTIAIEAVGSGPGGVTIRSELLSTTNVGDEPSDILFLPDNSEAIISLRSRSAVTIRDGSDLSSIEDLHFLSMPGNIPAFGSAGDDNGTVGVKHPHVMAMVGARQLFVLDRSSDSSSFDFDLFEADTTAVSGAPGNPLTSTDPARRLYRVEGLGTTHFDMQVDSSGNHLLVVGSAAQHEITTSEAENRDLETGFVQSWLWVLDIAPGTAPTVRSEAVSRVPSFLPSINLNRDYSVSNSLATLPSNETISQPTGLALLEDAVGIQKVVLCAFDSNAVLILTPDANAPGGWTSERVLVQPENLPEPGQSGYSISGPRAVVIHPGIADPSTPTQPGLAYVSNALDNSVVVINPFTAGIVARFQLQFDPTPQVIRSGREFLYGAFHSGSGTVSCASCHIDGHTDGLAWDLSAPTAGPTIPDGFMDKGANQDGEDFPAFKGPKVTQSLRGLVNSDINDEAQGLVSNAPYHWRGDKLAFTDFIGAFQDLMGRSQPLPMSDMLLYQSFVETIHHSPNPEQAHDRRIAGDGGDVNDPTDGNGTMQGMEVYFLADAVSGLSCVHCHAVPEGSNNRATESISHNMVPHPMETGALRHIVDREAVVRVDATLPTIEGRRKEVWTKLTGLFDIGEVVQSSSSQGPTFLRASINDFILRFLFDVNLSEQTRQAMQTNLIAFVRDLDTGSAPIIGQSHTMLVGQPAANAIEEARFIDQVEEANADLVAIVSSIGSYSLWWYDLTVGQYRQGASATHDFSYFETLANTAGTHVVLEAVPVGSGRRMASGTGVAYSDPGPAPSNVALLPMAPATNWERATSFTGNWDPNDPNHPLLFTGTGAMFSLQVQRAFQEALVASSDNFGVSVSKHQPPRRFRVVGDDLRPGAKLQLYIPSDSGHEVMEMNLYPTRYMDGGRRIWETTTEVDGEMTMALLNGGPFIGVVADHLDFSVLDGTGLDPQAYNEYGLILTNEVGGASPFVRMPLLVQDDR